VPQFQGYIHESLAVAEEMSVSLQNIASPGVSIIILNWNGLKDVSYNSAVYLDFR
jgi:hypothetical protein